MNQYLTPSRRLSLCRSESAPMCDSLWPAIVYEIVVILTHEEANVVVNMDDVSGKIPHAAVHAGGGHCAIITWNSPTFYP